MARPKPKPSTSTPKSRALQRSASRAQSATKRAAVYATPKIQESGVGWGNVARAVASIASRTGKQAPHGSLRAASQLSRAKAADAARATRQAKAAAKPSKPLSGSQKREMSAQSRAIDARLAAKKKKIQQQRTKDLQKQLSKPSTTFRGVKRYN
jgi:hypothetical protein